MFIDKDEEAIAHPYEDTLVVKVTLVEHELNRALVDGGNSVNILFE